MDNNTNGNQTSGTPAAPMTLSEWMYIHLFPIVIIGGCICNALIILTIQTRKFGQVSTRILIVSLAVTDAGVLVTGPSRHWLREQFNVNVRTLSAVSCPLHLFAIYFIMTLPGWIMSFIAVERLIAVFFPHKVKMIITPRRLTIVLIVTCLLAILLTFHFLTGFRLINGRCVPETDDYAQFIDGTYQMIYLIVNTLIPFGLIFICNCLIIYRLVQSRRQMKDSSTRDDKSSQFTSMTVMLIANAFVYLLLSAPAPIVYNLMTRYVTSSTQGSMAYSITNLISYANHAINFINYMAISGQFRREFIATFRTCFGHRKIKRRNYDSTVATSVTE